LGHGFSIAKVASLVIARNPWAPTRESIGTHFEKNVLLSVEPHLQGCSLDDKLTTLR